MEGETGLLLYLPLWKRLPRARPPKLRREVARITARDILVGRFSGDLILR
jgi:hypothetical protein